MKKRNTISKGILLSLLTFSIMNSHVYAAGFGFASTGGGSGGSGNIKIDPIEWKSYNVGTKKYQYRYKKLITTNNSISMNAYNLSGESLIPYNINDFLGEIKAGTWIGINVTETQSASWKVWDFEFQEIKKKYTCKYGGKTSTKYKTEKRCGITSSSCKRGETFTPFSGSSMMGCCKKTITSTVYDDTTDQTDFDGKEFDYYESSPTCRSEYKERKLLSQTVEEKENKLVDISSDETLAEAKKNEAVNDVHSAAVRAVGKSTISVEYITNNKYPEDIKKIIYNKATPSVIGRGDDYSSGSSSGQVWVEYFHSPSKVCINMKTAEVTYNDECVPNSDKGIVLLKNGTVYDKYLKTNMTYWHYFVPLNIKSSTKFPLRLEKNDDRILSAEECRYVMQNYIDYINYIIPSTSSGLSVYKGDYAKSGTKSVDWNKAKLGCYSKATINFPITQKFYNEEQSNDKTIFKGFAFYYRPININNPFPNGIANDSLWKEWESSNKKDPDLTKSFSSITYFATNINANSVRTYNKEHPYTSWSEMNLNGTSSYINSSSIIKRNNVSTKSFYNLGCGPSNKDWEECR